MTLPLRTKQRDSFLAALPQPVQSRAAEISNLDEMLGRLFETGRTMYPEVALEETAFFQHLAACVAGASDVEAALSGTRGPDLFLACACALGNARGMSLLDKQIDEKVPSALRRLRLNATAAEEVLQQIRVKLLVGEPGRPAKIREYSGRGPLQAWLRVVAVRVALDSVRGKEPIASGDESLLLNVMAGPADPEKVVSASRDVESFKAAFADAVLGLPAKERALLRLHFVDGLTIDEVGAVYRVHRATAARWVSRAREVLLGEIRRHLALRLQATDSELDSLMRGIRSQLDVSLCSFLASE